MIFLLLFLLAQFQTQETAYHDAQADLYAETGIMFPGGRY